MAFIELSKCALNLTGQTFERLTCLGPVKNTGRGILWLCQCSCGKQTKVLAYHLRRGSVKSCGCLKKEASYVKHGMYGTPEYNTWRSILKRCFNSKNPAYPRYGAAGITVCDRWKDSFEDFYADMGPRPADKTSIDRYPNNAGNYEPGNCRWATAEEQAKNTKATRMLTYQGTTLCINDWAKKLGINFSTLWWRLDAGWSVEDALTRPLEEQNHG